MTRAALTAAALAAALPLAGCPRRDAAPIAPPPKVVPGPTGSVSDGGMRHTARLSRVGWRAGGELQACGDLPWRAAHPPRSGPCLQAKPGAPAVAGSQAAGYTPDASPPESAPAGCRVRFDDAPGDPGAPPARATLIGASGEQPLDAWKPPREADGDYFAVETTWSPDGKWLGIVRSGVGIGEEGTAVFVADAEVRPAPACK